MDGIRQVDEAENQKIESKVRQLEDTISMLSARNDEHERLTQLSSDLAKAVSERDELLVENRNLCQKVKTLNDGMQNATRHSSALETELQAFRTSAVYADMHSIAQSESLQQLALENERLRIESKKFKETKPVPFTLDMRLVNRRKRASHGYLERLQSDLAQLKHREQTFLEIKMHFSLLENELDRKDEALFEMEQLCCSLQEKLALNAQKFAEEASIVATNYGKDIEFLNDRIRSQSEEIRLIASERQSLLVDLERLRVVASSKQSNDQEKESVSERKSSALASKLENSIRLYERSENRISLLQKEKEQKDSMIAILQETIGRIQSVDVDSGNWNVETHASVSPSKLPSTDVISYMKGLASKLLEYQKKEAMLENRCCEMKEKYSECQFSNESIQKICESLRKEAAGSKLLLEESRKENKRLMRDTEKSDKLVFKLSNELHHMSISLIDVKSQLSSAEKENEKAISQLQSLKQNLDDRVSNEVSAYISELAENCESENQDSKSQKSTMLKDIQQILDSLQSLGNPPGHSGSLSELRLLTNDHLIKLVKKSETFRMKTERENIVLELKVKGLNHLVEMLKSKLSDVQIQKLAWIREKGRLENSHQFKIQAMTRHYLGYKDLMIRRSKLHFSRYNEYYKRCGVLIVENHNIRDQLDKLVRTYPNGINSGFDNHQESKLGFAGIEKSDEALVPLKGPIFIPEKKYEVDEIEESVLIDIQNYEETVERMEQDIIDLQCRFEAVRYGSNDDTFSLGMAKHGRTVNVGISKLDNTNNIREKLSLARKENLILSCNYGTDINTLKCIISGLNDAGSGYTVKQMKKLISYQDRKIKDLKRRIGTLVANGEGDGQKKQEGGHIESMSERNLYPELESACKSVQSLHSPVRRPVRSFSKPVKEKLVKSQILKLFRLHADSLKRSKSNLMTHFKTAYRSIGIEQENYSSGRIVNKSHLGDDHESLSFVDSTVKELDIILEEALQENYLLQAELEKEWGETNSGVMPIIYDDRNRPQNQSVELQIEKFLESLGKDDLSKTVFSISRTLENARFQYLPESKKQTTQVKEDRAMVSALQTNEPSAAILQEQLNSCKKSHSVLETKLEQAESLVLKLHKENKSSESRKSELSEKLQKSLIEKANLEGELKYARESRQQQEEDFLKSKERQRAMKLDHEKTVSVSRNRIHDLERELDNAKKNLKKDVSKETDLLQRMETLSRNSKEKIRTVEKRAKKLKQMNEALSVELEEVKRDWTDPKANEELKEEIKSLKRERRKLRDQVSRQTEILASAKAKAKQELSEEEKIKAKITKLENRLKSSEYDASNKEKLLASGKEKVRVAEAQKEEIQKVCQTLRMRNSKLDQDINILRRKVTRLEEQNKDMESKLKMKEEILLQKRQETDSTHKSKIVSLKTKNVTLGKEVATLKGRLEELDRISNQKDKQIDDLMNAVGNCKDSLKEKTQMVDHLNKRMEIEKNEAEKVLEHAVTQRDNQITKLEEDVENFQRILEEKEISMNSMEKKLTDFRDDQRMNSQLAFELLQGLFAAIANSFCTVLDEWNEETIQNIQRSYHLQKHREEYDSVAQTIQWTTGDVFEVLGSREKVDPFLEKRLSGCKKVVEELKSLITNKVSSKEFAQKLYETQKHENQLYQMVQKTMIFLVRGTVHSIQSVLNYD